MAGSWSSDPHDRDAVRALDELLAHPDTWPTLPRAQVGRLLFYACLAYGLDSEGRDGEAVLRLHADAVGLLPSASRAEIVEQLGSAIERVLRTGGDVQGSVTSALLPFMLQDPDPAVVCAAASLYATLVPDDEEGPLAGPRAVRDLLEERTDGEGRAGLLAGLLQLGDSRVEPLVLGEWRHLDAEGRQSLALLIQSFHGVHALTVAFLVEWLAGEAQRNDEAGLGMAAATLGRAGRYALEHGVIDRRLAFPVTTAPPDSSSSVAAEWSGEGFGQRIRTTLLSLADLEPIPALLPNVLSLWGLDEDALHVAVRVAWANLREGEAVERQPIPLGLIPTWRPADPAVMEWGALAGPAPTIHTLRIVRLRHDGSQGPLSLFVYARLQPTHAFAALVGRAEGPDDRSRTEAAFVDLFRAEAERGEGWVVPVPDYVHVPPGFDVSRRAIEEGFVAGLVDSGVRAGDLSGATRHRRGSSSHARQVDAAHDSRQADAGVPTPSQVVQWLDVVAEPGHVQRVREQMPAAWERAQGNPE